MFYCDQRGMRICSVQKGRLCYLAVWRVFTGGSSLPIILQLFLAFKDLVFVSHLLAFLVGTNRGTCLMLLCPHLSKYLQLYILFNQFCSRTFYLPSTRGRESVSRRVDIAGALQMCALQVIFMTLHIDFLPNIYLQWASLGRYLPPTTKLFIDGLRQLYCAIKIYIHVHITGEWLHGNPYQYLPNFLLKSTS